MAVVVDNSSLTPGGKTFSELKSDVAKFILSPNDQDILQTAGEGIVDALRKINSVNWFWMLTSQDIPLVASTRTYSLAGQFKAPRHAEILRPDGTNAGRVYFLEGKSFSDETANSTASGSPSHYTIYNAQDSLTVSFNIAPDAGFVASYPTVRLRYHKRIQYPVNNSDVIDVPPEVESFILWHAKSYIAAIHAPQKVAYAEGKAQEMWKLLRVDDRNVSQASDWE